MVDLGPARRFLGMNIDTTESGFALYQTSYTESLLRRFKMTDAYGVDTLIDNHVSLDIAAKDTDRLIDQTEYLAIVGSLMYAAIGTRPGESGRTLWLYKEGNWLASLLKSRRDLRSSRIWEGVCNM